MGIMTNYDMAVIFTKRTNLLQWFECNCRNISSKQYELMRQNYANEQDVELVLLARHEDGYTYCKIKCPINPLPVRGEFVAISVNEIIKFLQRDGWCKKQVISARIFQ